MRTIAHAEVLGPADVVPHRSFSHPDHVAADRAVLSMLIRDFGAHLASAPVGQPTVRFLPAPDEWHRRVVIPDPAALGAYAVITVVGFFGRVEDGVEPEVADRIKSLGARLVDAVLATPGVLGYTTHLLADERNYANLVLVSSADVIERWRTTAPHPTAAEEWSPRYYRHLRIYRGAVNRSELDSGAVRLDSVKYWDYRCDPIWHAIRKLH